MNLELHDIKCMALPKPSRIDAGWWDKQMIQGASIRVNGKESELVKEGMSTAMLKKGNGELERYPVLSVCTCCQSSQKLAVSKAKAVPVGTEFLASREARCVCWKRRSQQDALRAYRRPQG